MGKNGDQPQIDDPTRPLHIVKELTLALAIQREKDFCSRRKPSHGSTWHSKCANLTFHGSSHTHKIKMARTASSETLPHTTSTSSPHYRANTLESQQIYIVEGTEFVPTRITTLVDRLTSTIQPLMSLPVRTPYDSIYSKLAGEYDDLSSIVAFASTLPSEARMDSILSESPFTGVFWASYIYNHLAYREDLAMS